MKFVVDRFEENYAVLEDMETREIRDVLINQLPSSIKEGSILNCYGEEYFLDEYATDKRRQYVMDRFERLKNNTSD